MFTNFIKSNNGRLFIKNQCTLQKNAIVLESNIFAHVLCFTNICESIRLRWKQYTVRYLHQLLVSYYRLIIFNHLTIIHNHNNIPIQPPLNKCILCNTLQKQT